MDENTPERADVERTTLQRRIESATWGFVVRSTWDLAVGDRPVFGETSEA